MTLRTSAEHLPADVFGLSKTARAALAAGTSFGPVPVPLRVEDVPKPDERLGRDERAALVDAIDAGFAAADVGLPVAARERLEALRDDGVFAVVTGQQPGFLTSPLYCLYKALQACRIASELEARWGTRVAPIFWNHADDHDIAEVHHAWQLNRNLDLQKVGLPGLSSGRTPVGDIALDEEAQTLGALRAQLRSIVEEHPFADDAIERFLPRDGETLARAFTRTMTELAGRFGLVVCEPAWIRGALASETGRVVAGGSIPFVDALREGEAELEGLGLAPAIPLGDARAAADAAAALVYLHDREGGRPERVALRAGGDGFVRDGQPGSWTHAEVASRVVDEPANASAGALLRPIVQDGVFPTCAYVGGYGELAYHAQLGRARENAGLVRTPFIPRVGLTLVDDDLAHGLQRVEATVADVLAARGEFVLESAAPSEPEVAARLRELAADTKARMMEHKAALAELEPALAITLKKTAGHVEQSIGKVIDKAKRVHDNRAGKGARQVRRVNHSLYPRGAPQERVLGPFQFSARWGDDFVDALAQEIPAMSTEHIVLRIEEDTDE